MENIIVRDIKEYGDFVKIEFIDKGYSNDKKYYIETSNDEKLLMRVADIKEYNRKKNEFNLMNCLSDIGVPMSIPVNFGIFNNGKNIYSLFKWCDGEKLCDVIGELTDEKQYELGLELGAILRKVHSISVPADYEDWEVRFSQKTNNVIQCYRAGSVKADSGEIFIDYIEKNSHLLKNRTQYFLHNDFHMSNIIIDNEYKLKIIDFSEYDYGDPWTEFIYLFWWSEDDPKIAIGCINGYFNNKPPELFFKLLAYYTSIHALTSLYSVDINNQENLVTAIEESAYLLRCCDNMKNPVPTWYSMI